MSEREITAAILAVGTELTEGSTQDSHGKYLAGTLAERGIVTREILLLPDDRRLFAAALRRLTGECDLVVVTGGLGPTSDDLTREVIAESAGVDLEFHEKLWQEISAHFAGRRISETNRKQAYLPAGFTVIPNPYGTAPAFWGRMGDRRGEKSAGALVVALPGPPRELRPLVTDHVLDLLHDQIGGREAEILAGTSFLLGESALEELLREVRVAGIEWGTRAEPFRVAFRLRGGTAEQREGMFEALAARVGSMRIRRGEVEAERLLLDTLRNNHFVIALAESCTGGLGAKLLTDIPGASDQLWGSFVVYSNEAKQRMLGVPEDTIRRFGAVSRETVSAMAAGAIEQSSAQVSYAVSGIAGPGGGTADKPVGTVWIGVLRREGVGYERRFHFSGDRDMVRRKSVVAAMLLTEGYLMGREVDKDENWQYI